MAGDVIAAAAETGQGTALLQPVMRNGRRLAQGRVTLQQAREHAHAQLAALPAELQALESAAQGYPVQISPRLLADTRRLQAELERSEIV